MLNNAKKMFHDIWIKGKHYKKLTSDEQEIYDIMDQHTEYYIHFEVANSNEIDYHKEEFNPFLHLSFHILLQKNINNKNFPFLKDYLKKVSEKYGKHNAEHIILDIIMEKLVSVNGNFNRISPESLREDLDNLIIKIKNDEVIIDD